MCELAAGAVIMVIEAPFRSLSCVGGDGWLVGGSGWFAFSGDGWLGGGSD